MYLYRILLKKIGKKPSFLRNFCSFTSLIKIILCPITLTTKGKTLTASTGISPNSKKKIQCGKIMKKYLEFQVEPFTIMIICKIYKLCQFMKHLIMIFWFKLITLRLYLIYINKTNKLMINTESMPQAQPQEREVVNSDQQNIHVQGEKDSRQFANKQETSRIQLQQIQPHKQLQFPPKSILKEELLIKEEVGPVENQEQVTQFQPTIIEKPPKSPLISQNSIAQTQRIQETCLPQPHKENQQAELQVKQEIQVIQNGSFDLPKVVHQTTDNNQVIQKKPQQHICSENHQTIKEMQNLPQAIQTQNIQQQKREQLKKEINNQINKKIIQPTIAKTILQNKSNVQKENKDKENTNTILQKQEEKLDVLLAEKIEEKSNEQQEKQKYRLNSQFVQSIQEEKQKRVVQFVQFTPNSDHKPPHQELVEKSTQKNQLNFSFSQKTVVKQQNQQSLDQNPHSKGQIQKTQSPHKKITGKIAKKILHDKKIHNAIVDLQKHDQKKIVIPAFEQSKKIDKKIDLSKLQSQITLNSNILSLTIGELITKDEDEATKLLQQIKELKKRLYSIQMSKREDEDEDESNQNIQLKSSTPVDQYVSTNTHLSPQKHQNSIQQQSMLSNKHKKRQNLGKIYQKIEYNNSRISQQLEAAGIMTQRRGTNIIKQQQNKYSARPKVTSTQDLGFVSKSNNKQKTIENKTTPISFRVRKNSKNFISPCGDSQERLNQFVNSQGKDQWFQTKRQTPSKIYYGQEKLKVIEKPIPRELKFQQNFKEHISKYFIDLGELQLKRQLSQQDLVQLAKVTFKKFGLNLQMNKQTTLHVKKYKNCVSFIVDISRTILWYYEGKFYYGGWITNGEGEGQKSGWGYDYCPGKFIYSGNFKYNKRDGYGIMKFLTKENDVIYEGFWKNGFKSGYGKQKEADSSIFIGQWSEGKKNGKGKLIVSQTQIFDGTYLNGIKNGSGFEKFSNGDTYEGDYLQGKFHGLGTYTWANHSRYQGQFQNGSRNGNGIWISDYTDSKSDSYEGQYLNDKKSGFGLYKWKDGTTYQGQFLNDLKHGEGVVTYANGKSTYLQWFQGNIVEQEIPTQKLKGIKHNGSKQSSERSQEQKEQNKIPLSKFGKKINFKPKATKLLQQF